MLNSSPKPSKIFFATIFLIIGQYCVGFMIFWTGYIQHGLLSLYSIRLLSKTNCVLEICFVGGFVVEF